MTPLPAAQAQQLVLDALEFMRKHESDPNRCFGYASGALCHIAGTPGAPLPPSDGSQAVRS